jgi:hypothetical protein
MGGVINACGFIPGFDFDDEYLQLGIGNVPVSPVKSFLYLCILFAIK